MLGLNPCIDDSIPLKTVPLTPRLPLGGLLNRRAQETCAHGTALQLLPSVLTSLEVVAEDMTRRGSFDSTGEF